MNALCAKDVLLYPQSGDDSEIQEAIQAAIEALGKQIPKKPNEDFPVCYCPVCKRLVYPQIKYCPDCGQALDWGKKE